MEGLSVTPVELVIFDCDGVLADSEVISAEVLVRKVASHGVQFDPEYVYKNFVGKSFPVVAGIIRTGFRVDLPDIFEAEYRSALVAEFAKRLAATPGLHEMLAVLDRPVCVATSSSPPRVARTLDLLRLADQFADNVFTASQVSRGKPAPDLFQFAAAQMGADPARSLVIEDSAAGVEAGLAAGMQVWRYIGGSHFTDRDAARAATPDGVAVFDNWDQFYLMAPDLQI